MVMFPEATETIGEKQFQSLIFFSWQVLKSLNKTYKNQKRKPVAIDLDPKAVTCDELFGIINPATREWKDGRKQCSSFPRNGFEVHLKKKSNVCLPIVCSETAVV